MLTLTRHKAKAFFRGKKTLVVTFVFLVLLGFCCLPRKVIILVDGEKIERYAYRGTRVEQIIEEAGVALREEDRVVPGRHEELAGERVIEVERAFPLYIDVDGKRLAYLSPPSTVGTLLEQAGIQLGPLDLVEPAKDSMVAPEQVVLIRRMTTTRETEAVIIPFREEVIWDRNLPLNTVRIKNEGAAGLMEKLYRVVAVDGKEKSRELLAVNWIKKSEARVIVKGKGLYALSRSGVRSGDEYLGRASWYGAGFQGLKTASGEIFDLEAMTAAHPFLPFNTLVSVKNLKNGREVIVRINDRGPFTPGRIIDLSRAAAETLGMIRAGVVEVRVKVLKLP
ncbi:MAG TPA: septal ring lytic transglycosylase RlpA family protein [Firmicutes bacterium]|nr:septal ring lytic transglycosylase RlpA family protein [Bacillota bacterium]